METNYESKDLARRAFLEKCGKFAIATPPIVTLMLSASARGNYAVALSGSGPRGHHEGHGGGYRHHGNNGFGNGGHDGVPGHSNHEDNDR